VIAAFNNLFALRQSFTYTTGRHAFRFGAEVRLNRDTTYFGTSPNGEYDFGGGTAYSRVEMASQSGAHVIHVGDPLPDTLSSLLSGSPFAYTRAIARPTSPTASTLGQQLSIAIKALGGFKIRGRFRSFRIELRIALRVLHADYGTRATHIEHT